MLDSSEYNLYEIDQKMTAAGYANFLPLIGDVRHTFVMQSVFRQFKPQVVVHAAALKHVPMLEIEHNMIEGVRTNVSGTKVVAECVAECDWVESFTLISTDKAVNPTSFMGLTKRCAEKVMRMFEDERFSIVRFGNVFGTSGSVVPLFEKQILAGGPVTVTHPDMTRYMMAVSEAVSLVLASAALNTDYHNMGTYVLDMGKAIKISDLACALIRMHGMEPGKHIDINYVGMRPGEKLEEELLYPYERFESTDVEGIMRVNGDPLSQYDKEAVLQLSEYAEERDGAGVKGALLKIVPEYQDELPDVAQKKTNGSAAVAADFNATKEDDQNGRVSSDVTPELLDLNSNYSVSDWIESLSMPSPVSRPDFLNARTHDSIHPNNGRSDFRVPDAGSHLTAKSNGVGGGMAHPDQKSEGSKRDN
jgi:O-antigen biosynthesis protein WbqV